MGYFIKTGVDTTPYTAEELAVKAEELLRWEAKKLERVATASAREERRAVIDAALVSLPVSLQGDLLVHPQHRPSSNKADAPCKAECPKCRVLHIVNQALITAGLPADYDNF